VTEPQNSAPGDDKLVTDPKEKHKRTKQRIRENGWRKKAELERE
jgi:hypothetical protein